MEMNAGKLIHAEFHCHTVYSLDSGNRIQPLLQRSAEMGIERLAITDHNTTSHMPVIDGWRDAPLLLVPGEEVTTYSGHANVWGLREWVDFRVTTDEEMQRVFRWVESRKRPFSMNHPKRVGPPWQLADPGFGVREVWQAPWRWYNWESVGAWDEQLAAGRRIVPVGGSDAHSAPPAEPVHPHHVGDPTTWLYCAGGLNEEFGESKYDLIADGLHAIEIKKDPDLAEYDRLFGQVARHLQHQCKVVVLIIDASRKDKYDNFISLVDTYLNVNDNTVEVLHK